MFCLCWLLACVAPPSTGREPHDDVPLPTDTGLLDTGTAASPLRPMATPSGTCPSLDAPGEQWLESFGIERRALVLWPADLQPDAPMLIFFHGRYQSPEEILVEADLQRVVDEAGAVVVLPHSTDPSGDAQTWSDLDPGRDTTLFDDLRSCLVRDLGVDPHRVHVGGFSGGGLFATRLLQVRSDAMASFAPFSGGIEPDLFPYRAAEVAVPALITWGGAADTAIRPDNGLLVSFEETSLRLSEGLVEDGHVVAHCVHEGGHRVPGAAPELLMDWMDAHTFGQPSPVVDGLEGYPPFCALVAPEAFGERRRQAAAGT